MFDLDDRIRVYADYLEETTPQLGAETARRIAQSYPRYGRLVPAIVAAITMILVIAAVVILDPFGSEGPFIEEPTTIPTTTPSVTPTTTTVVEDTTMTTITAPEVPVITWTLAFMGEGTFEEMQSVALTEGGYVAVGNDYWNADAAIWRSSDGVAWERVAIDDAVFGGEGSQWGMDVAARGDVVVAVGSSEPPGSFSSVTPVAWTSTDAGETWQRIELEGTGGAWAVTATDDRFVAGGDGIWTSTDGVDWRPVADNAGAFGIVSIAHSERGFVAVGNSDNQAAVWTSQDGEVWQRVPHDDGLFGVPPHQLPTTSGSTWINDVIATPDGFIAVGVSRKPTVWTSPDGYNWSRTPNQPAAKGGYQPIEAVTQTGTMLVAVGFHQIHSYVDPGGPQNEALAWVSLDGGQTWITPADEGTAFGTPVAQIYPNDVVADGTRLVAVGYHTNSAAMPTPTNVAIWTATIEP